MNRFILIVALSCSGCVSIGYHNRTLRETRDEKVNIYEMIRKLKDRKFTRKI